MESALSNIYVRGRCACGKRYRVKNAAAGVTVLCPNCQRPITIADADMRAAQIHERFLPIQDDSTEIREALLIDHGELNLAPEGSRPGLTGEVGYDNDEALLMRAMRGVSMPFETDDNAGGWTWGALVDREPGRRPFIADVFASFYFAGSRGNAINLGLITLGCWIPLLIANLFFMTPLILLIIPVAVFISLYTFQFYWSTLRMTAGGHDIIPWIQSDWDLWDDAARPLFGLLVLSILCSAPALAMFWWLPGAGLQSNMVIAALAVGWFFWPVGVMSLALGNSVLFLRPDWLVRCVMGIGPAYLVAWFTVLIALACWTFSTTFITSVTQSRMLTSGLVLAVNFYCGYVVFRTFGLLFRHFRERFPWKF